MGEINIKIDLDDFGFDISTDDFTSNEVVAYLFKIIHGLIEDGAVPKEDAAEMLGLD